MIACKMLDIKNNICLRTCACIDQCEYNDDPKKAPYAYNVSSIKYTTSHNVYIN